LKNYKKIVFKKWKYGSRSDPKPTHPSCQSQIFPVHLKMPPDSIKSPEQWKRDFPALRRKRHSNTKVCTTQSAPGALLSTSPLSEPVRPQTPKTRILFTTSHLPEHTCFNTVLRIYSLSKTKPSKANMLLKNPHSKHLPGTWDPFCKMQTSGK
jgi:hypothetical protein